jgi:pimeloyl-ACP methyl ester carboxylesterase
MSWSFPSATGVDVHETTTRYFGDLATHSYGDADGRPPLLLVHGLSFDRQQWRPVVDELATIDPGRRVLAVDLPGHGGSPARDSYPHDDVVAAIHRAATETGIEAPIVVGHSLGGALATAYAAAYPTRGVVNVDQPLLVGRFKDMLERAEPVLRSPAHGHVWASMLANMRIELLPPAAQDLVRSAGTPPQALMLGYWDEVINTPAGDLTERRIRDLETIRSNGTPYRYVTGGDPDPAYRQWLESVLPGVTITVLPDSGHFPHLAHPAEFARILVG